MNQKITPISQQWKNTVVGYTVYKVDPQDNNKEIILKKGIYETLNPIFQTYLTGLVDNEYILCNSSNYDNNKTYYNLTKTKLIPSNNIADYVYVKYSLENSIGCCHQCSGSRIVCKICNNEYVCQLCHDDQEDHEFEFLAVRCNYCNHEYNKMSINCPKCLQILCNVYCDKCYWASDYDYFISSQQHVCPENDIVCAICQEPIHYSKYTSLQCSHRFHTACMAIAKLNQTNNCPLCRGNIHRQDNFEYMFYQLQTSNINKIVKINCHECDNTTYDYQGCFNICTQCKSTNCTIIPLAIDYFVNNKKAKLMINPHKSPVSIQDILNELTQEQKDIYKQILDEDIQNKYLTEQAQLNIALQIKYLKDNNLEITPSMFLHNINPQDSL